MTSLGTIPKRNRTGSQATGSVSGPDLAHGQNYPSVSAPISPSFFIQPEIESIPPERIKFKEAVEKAENSTLIFNLNMGRVPILNTATMSTRATLALAAMAAETESTLGNVPTDDKIAGIDDILSLAKNMEFFGRKTKS
jgi:hypothetical protein